MQILTAAEMRACDDRTVQEAGISWEALMENAGRALAEFVAQQFPEAARIVVLCGKGNNGGDGLVAARHLAAAGHMVELILLSSPEQMSELEQTVYRKLPEALRTAAQVMATEADVSKPQLEACLRGADLFLDAIVGTGFRPPLRGVAAWLRDRVAGYDAPVVSVDLPSGWDADSTAMQASDAFRSSAVITFTAPKCAHVFGAMTRGPVVVAPIGSPESATVSENQLTWSGVSHRIVDAPRALDSNKGRFGHVLVVGGSPGKGGAAAMASIAAMRAGAGLVTAAIPRSVAGVVAGFAPEMMTIPLESASSGGISIRNMDASRMDAMLRGMSVVAIGPGIGREPETVEFVRELIRRSEVPTVLDADGLNAFAGAAALLDGRKRPLVLTPHPGEMARLLGCTIPEVERDRIGVARTFAQEHGVTLVLKGWRTLIAHPDGQIAVNTSGNPALAKGGSGDILTGLVAGMVAQFPKQLREAVECAVWLHGAAADRFVEKHSERTMLATELLEHLSAAMLHGPEHHGWAWLQGGFQEGQR